MRIGIYNPAVGTRYAGGTETFLREMIRRLAQHHEVFLYTGSGTLVPELVESKVTVRQFPFLDKSRRLTTLFRTVTADQLLSAEVESVSLFAGTHLARRIAADDLDVLSTHYYLDNLLISRVVDVPTLFRFPGIRNPSLRWRVMARYADPALYVSNSETTAGRVDDWLGIEVEGTVYAGVDTDRFRPTVEPAIETGAFTALFVGRLDPGKGLFELLDALAIVRRHTNVELLFVGDGILRSDLESRAKELDIQESTTFVGEVEHSDIHRYYASCDSFILPSEHEGFPVVNIEAMASGKPVVSTHIPAVEEQIVDGKDGLLVDVGDVEALAGAIERLATDAELCDRLGDAARRKAVESFTWEVQAERMAELYERAIELEET
jgi:glycosyltransferase involved in cell wall biosynthesis